MDPMLVRQGLVPVVAILTGALAILMPVAIVAVVLYWRHRRTQALYDTVKHLADQGQPVPPELLEPPRPAKPDSPLFGALTLLGAGVGIAVMFHTMHMPQLIGIGALAACVGIAQIVSLRIDVERAVARLPEHERRAVIHSFRLDLTHGEAAAVLGLPLGTLKAQVARAKERLRGWLGAWQPEDTR
jgi:DNA-directed RNA polymerase specialized sigma24 family protein